MRVLSQRDRLPYLFYCMPGASSSFCDLGDKPYQRKNDNRAYERDKQAPPVEPGYTFVPQLGEDEPSRDRAYYSGDDIQQATHLSSQPCYEAREPPGKAP